MSSVAVGKKVMKDAFSDLMPKCGAAAFSTWMGDSQLSHCLLYLEDS